MLSDDILAIPVFPFSTKYLSLKSIHTYKDTWVDGKTNAINHHSVLDKLWQNHSREQPKKLEQIKWEQVTVLRKVIQ